MKPLVDLIIKSFDFSGALIVYIALSGIVSKYISPAIGGVIFIYTFIAFWVCMGVAATGSKSQKDIKEGSSRPQPDSLDVDQLIKTSRAAYYRSGVDITIPNGDNMPPELDFDEAKIKLDQNGRKGSFKERYDEAWKSHTADGSRDTPYPSRQINHDIEQEHRILDSCESEPEKIFLSEMIAKYHLSSNEPFLLTGGVTVELQRVIGRHRVDFLINNRFVVEIDGRKYHEKRFYGDRMRDQDVIEEGFIVIRFPAAQVYRDAQGCCDKVDNIIKAHS